MVRGAAVLRRHRHDAEFGVRQERSIRKRIVDAGGGVERDVDVLLLPPLVAALRIDVVDLQRGDGSHLPLDADRRLPAAVDVVGRRFLQLAVAAQQARRVAGKATGPPGGEVGRLLGRRAIARQRLVVGGRRAVERVGGEIGPAIVQHLDDRHRAGFRRIRRLDHFTVVLAGAAAHDRPVVPLVREPEARLDVGRVLGTSGLHERQEFLLVLEHVPQQVVAHAEVQRQPAARVPVVLQPCAVARDADQDRGGS